MRRPRKQNKLSLLEDFSKLRITTSTLVSVNGKEQISNQEEIDYPLRQVTTEEIATLRMSDEPGFILKIEGKYLYASIPKTLNCSSSKMLGKYLCATCQRFSSKPDCAGGCVKVRDSDFNEYRMLGFSEDDAYELSKRLEKYSFISEGYETFNTSTESLVITKCAHYHLCDDASLKKAKAPMFVT